jgi:hypothetical protein
MRVSSFTFLSALVAAASFVNASPLNRRNSEFFAPKDNGGSQLGSFGGDGEPLNVCFVSSSSILRSGKFTLIFI